MGNWFPTLRDNVALSTSRARKSNKERFLFRMFRIGHVDTQLIISEYATKYVNSKLYKEKLLSVKLGQFVFCHNYSVRQHAGVKQRLEYLSA